MKFETKVRKNLMYWYNIDTNAMGGVDWYIRGNKFCYDLSIEYNLPIDTIAKIVSCLSPHNKWERNKYDTNQMIEAYSMGGSIDSFKVCTFTPNKLKAWNLLTLGIEPKFGNKTYSFYRNLLLDKDHVTIDLWHIRACKGGKVSNEFKTLTDKRYRDISAITSSLAHELGLTPFKLQSIIWVNIRDNWIY